MYRQDPPFSVQIELTEGCNLRCSFCGINGIRGPERTFSFMTEETAFRIAREIARCGWGSRIEFAMHGEPTRNPLACSLISIFRKELPYNYFLMETNGSGFVRGSGEATRASILEYFHAGMSTIAVDEYEGIPWANSARQAVSSGGGLGPGVHIYEYPAQKEGNPHHPEKRFHRFVIIAPINRASHGTHSFLCNHGGAAAPLNLSQEGKRCALPFREVSFRWNGKVALCCNDWRGVYKIGGIHEMSLDEIWHSPAFYAARRKLLHGLRDFPPCRGCDYRTPRLGLLPDKFGKESYPLPDASTEGVLRRAVAGSSYTLPVARPWEVKGMSLGLKGKLF